MNNTIEILKEIYKPYRYTYIGKVIIFETTQGNLVIKKKNKDIKNLYNYLSSRSFNNYPELIDESRDEVNVFKYIEDISNPKEQKAQDLIKLVSLLHNKTSYYKDVTDDKFKSIYDDILSNINYLNDYYNNLYDTYYNDIMMSPSKYLFMNNYSKINNCIKFCREELDKWYNLVKDNNKIRVVQVHNNLLLDHFIKNNQDYLISWDNSIIDSPILDIVNLYKKEYFDINFNTLLKIYTDNFKLNEDEEKLLFILISLPYKIEFNNNELINCTNIRSLLDYIYKTEELIRPYYLKDEKE